VIEPRQHPEPAGRPGRKRNVYRTPFALSFFAHGQLFATVPMVRKLFFAQVCASLRKFAHEFLAGFIGKKRDFWIARKSERKKVRDSLAIPNRSGIVVVSRESPPDPDPGKGVK